jgi:thioredoxin reductase (NADPH)
MAYTECVTLLTNGEVPQWDQKHDRWLREFKVPIILEKIVRVAHEQGCIVSATLDSGHKIAVDFMFTTRGDVFHNTLARQLNAALDDEGQVIVDKAQRTSVPGLYAAGCVTPANCQMIIAAGHGAAAAQAINRDLFEVQLASGHLRGAREEQIARGNTEPEFLRHN